MTIYQQQSEDYNSVIEEVTIGLLRFLSGEGFGCLPKNIPIDRYRHDTEISVFKGDKEVKIHVCLHLKRKQIRVMIGDDLISFPCGKQKIALDKLLKWCILRVKELICIIPINV